nr:reverse transcriptase domain-containing protein [Tanacetum cinerariifolium]
MEDDFKLDVQHQRRVNPKIREVIKSKVIKLLNAGLIYPISDSPWVNPIHVVPKKGGITKTDAFLSLDDSIPPVIDNGIYDSVGDILFLKELLNDDPTPDLPPPLLVFENNETEKNKTSIDYPSDLELKDLPPYLEYVFLDETSKLPVIIVKDLKWEEK